MKEQCKTYFLKFPSILLQPPPPTTPHHSSFPPVSHCFLKGPNQTKKLVKSHLSMSLNLFRTFLSLKTSSLIIFCKKIFWDKIDQKLEYVGGGGAHMLNCARATTSIHFSTCKILPLKNTLISHFQVLLVKNVFFCYFSHVPWDNQSHLQKEPGPKVLSFSWNFALTGYIHTITHITRL